MEIYRLLARTFRRTCTRLPIGVPWVVAEQFTSMQPVIELTALLASASLPKHISLMLNLRFGRFW